MNDEIIFKNFWSTIDYLLEKNGTTFKDMCDKLEISYGSLRAIKSKGQVPTNLNTITQIADYLNIPVEYLLTGNKNEIPLDIQQVAFQLAKLDPEQRKPIIALIEGQINFWIEAFKK